MLLWHMQYEGGLLRTPRFKMQVDKENRGDLRYYNVHKTSNRPNNRRSSTVDCSLQHGVDDFC